MEPRKPVLQSYLQGSKRGTDILDTVGDGEGGTTWEHGIETHVSPHVTQIASGRSVYEAGRPKPVLCDSPERWGGEGPGRGASEEGTHAYLTPIHVDVWHKPSHYCEAIIL